MRDARASDDAQYDPFDDEESIPSLPELKEDDDDPIPMLQEATAATTRPSLQSDDDIPDLLDAPKQEDNSVDLEILHALAASPIRDARPASPDAELSVGDLGGGDDDLEQEELGITFKPVEQELLESPARPKVQNEDVLDEEEVSDDDAVAPSRRNSLSSAGRPATPEPVEPVSQPPTTPAAASDVFSDVEELETAQLPKTPAADDDLSDVEELGATLKPADDSSDAEEMEPAPANPATTAVEFAVGSRVEARFDGSEAYYPGKIFAAHPDNTYYVHFDDGDTEDNVPAAYIRKAAPAVEEPIDEPLPADELPAEVADKVDDGDDFLAGIEDELGLDTTAQESETPADDEPPKSAEPSQPANPSSDDDLSDVLADLDEDLPGLDLEKPAEPEEPARPPAPATEPAFAVGSHVEARFNGSDAFYPGKIFAAHPDGTYYIRFDDGDEEDNVPAAFVRKVDAPATEDPIDEPVAEVPAAAADGDGDDFLAGIEDELGLDTTAEKADEKPPVKSAEPSRPATTSHDDDLSEPARPPAPAFAVGSHVEARFNGGDAFYPGKIFAAHPDGTYFLKYDDGDEEDNVPASYIRPEPTKQTGSMLADLEDSSDGEVSLRQVTPPAEDPAAAQPEQEEDILAGLDDLGLNTMSVAEPPAAEKPPAADKPADEFDYDELEADLFGGSDDAKPGTAGTRPTTVDSRDYDDSRPSTYDSRPGTDGYSYSNYDSRPETREPESKPGTAGTAAGFYDSRPQTEGTDYNFDDDFSDFEI